MSSILLTFITAFIFAWIAAIPLIRWLQRHNIQAASTPRGMHDAPTPVGGGWLVVPPALLAYLVFSHQDEPLLRFIITLATIILMLVSWHDDRKSVRPGVRIIMQALAVAAVLIALPSHEVVFSRHWPLWADRLLTALLWLWFINLFNFMDGIDGLAASETIIIAMGVVLLGIFTPLKSEIILTAAALAGAAAGFLHWNWHRAKLFLGDVGAIPLGFLLGFLLIRLAIQGHLAAAFILPGYFIADASLTLLRRIVKGEPFWQPHRKHFYQRATLSHGNHARTILTILPANIALIVLAIVSMHHPLVAAMATIAILALLLSILQWQAER